MITEKIEIKEAPRENRLDVFLTVEKTEYSRSFWQNKIKNGSVLVNGQKVKTGFLLTVGDCITIDIQAAKEVAARPQNIALDILYEDNDIIVVNKPQGMVVHPAAGNEENTLVNALLYHCDDLSGINGEIRPGIVHRLDKDTSGVLVVAKNDQAHIALAKQLKEHKMQKTYWALVKGGIGEQKGSIDAPIGRHAIQRKKMAVDAESGRQAITHYEVLERFRYYTLLQVQIETGRTHQIRVHLAYINHPIAGDPVYGGKCNLHLAGQALHAKKLGFYHPIHGNYMEIEAPLPAYWPKMIDAVKRE